MHHHDIYLTTVSKLLSKATGVIYHLVV